jgi:LPS O-antigen subunit length determinant protein (WzzB/FepE family)
MTIAALVILSALIGAMTGAFVAVITHMYFMK